jgi:hypothetical protein
LSSAPLHVFRIRLSPRPEKRPSTSLDASLKRSERAQRANHFAAIRSIRAEIDAAAVLTSLLDEDFLHKPLGMLNASSRQFF